MNSYYNQNKYLQWLVALMMLGAAGLTFHGWMLSMRWSIMGIGLVFILTPLCQFLIAPTMKLTGVYRYVSPMLLIYAANDKKYDLHNGTSFDYLFVYRSRYSSGEWQNVLLQFYIDGLLCIIEKISSGKVPETVEVRGSSYFFSDRTARKMGFELSRTGSSEKFNIIINYLDLLWMYSLSKGGLRFPKLSNVKTASTTGKVLVEHKDVLLRMKAILVKRNEDVSH